MKFTTGDRVEIIWAGHPIWGTDPYKKNSKVVMTDLQPQLVGKKATIVEGTEVQKGYEQYSLQIDGVGKCSWFGLKQMKKI